MTYELHEFIQDLANSNIPPDEKIFGYFSKTDTKRLGRLVNRLHRARDLNVKAIANQRASANTQPGCKRKHLKVKQKQVEGAKSRLIGKIFEKIVHMLCKDCILDIIKNH